jgi:FAD/FMN-containing dehydrogenase
VLKRLGPGGPFLSFPREGYTITLDFPVNAAMEQTAASIDNVLRDLGGRVYLAKDARAPRDIVENGYPDIERFRALRGRIDPQRKLRSLLSDRLRL